jgi:isopentenyl-diphosphate Delta-isomerase
MKDEPVDVINENNVVISQLMKSTVHEKGLRHRISAVLIQDKMGKFFIPKASELKSEAGGLYHSAAGHVLSGETYLAAAKRELWEETGLEAGLGEFTDLGTFWLEKQYPGKTEKERFEVFKLKYDPRMGEIKLNDEQVEGEWLSEEELNSIYLKSPERLSTPLKLCFENIFKFGK